jgi:CHASE2 domain-containing sensor protein
MPFGLEGILRNVSKIKLKGGVVGKVSVVLIVVSLAMAAIAWSVRVPWISVVALVLLFVLSFVMLWRLVSFADKNPQAALLEGAEFLVHEQITLGTKAQPKLQTDMNQQEQAAPLEILPSDPSVGEADAPEATAGSSSDGG